jgi:hypothetical protein
MARIVIPERIRLIKLLRAHGLRAVERLREDELKDALKKLGLAVPPEEPQSSQPPPREGPWSATVARGMEDLGEEPPPPAPGDGRDVRYDEPPLDLPDGRRTFVRLVAVSPERLFATWELDENDSRAPGADHLEIVAADDKDGPALMSTRVDRASHSWYTAAPDERIALAARLRIGGRVVARSNTTWVPPSRPAPPGPLVFATVPVSVDRRDLRGGKLTSARLGDALPAGVSLDDTGEHTSAGAHTQPADAPASGDLAPTGAPSSWSLPSSHSLPEPSRSSQNASGGAR